MTNDDAARIERLERRLERERAAREQAEAIAERGMRDLWQNNRTLEARVAARTAELAASLDAATMAADAKERFLGDLGHELNTPLHAALGRLELIDASALGEMDQTRLREVGDNVSMLAESLGGLIELAAATGAPAPGDSEVMRLSAWLDGVIARWTRPAAARGQLLVPSITSGDGHDVDGAEVRLDWRRAHKIIDALLANVTEHAEPGAVSIEIGVDGDQVSIVVSDSGPGMNAEELATAREPFVRFGSGAGRGIGLAIVHRLAVSAGGTLDLGGDGATVAAVTLHRSE